MPFNRHVLIQSICTRVDFPSDSSSLCVFKINIRPILFNIQFIFVQPSFGRILGGLEVKTRLSHSFSFQLCNNSCLLCDRIDIMDFLPFSSAPKGFSGENCSMKIHLALNRIKLRKKKRAEMAEGIKS